MDAPDVLKKLAGQTEGCIKSLGAETTQALLDKAKNEDCIPACCYNCPYSTDCDEIGIIPWLLTCERYSKWKHTWATSKPELTLEQRLERLERAFYIFANRQHETNCTAQDELRMLLDSIRNSITEDK